MMGDGLWVRRLWVIVRSYFLLLLLLPVLPLSGRLSLRAQLDLTWLGWLGLATGAGLLGVCTKVLTVPFLMGSVDMDVGEI